MEKGKIREAAVAGRFYPLDSTQLQFDLDAYFKKQQKIKIDGDIKALIVPHAGYVFSAEVAASAFCLLNNNAGYENIFILAPSHGYSISGASVYNIGNYETPLGEVVVNTALAEKLIADNAAFKSLPEAHLNEHSIEVQLPFLQYLFKEKFQIVPILIGTQNDGYLKEIARGLLPYFNNKNLFIISTDFSHFPNNTDAQIADARMCDAICMKTTQGLLLAVEQNKHDKFTNLSTSACGLSAIMVLLYLVENHPEMVVSKIKYMNSSQSKYGDTNRVVGYASFAFYAKNNWDVEFELTPAEKITLLKIAHNTIKNKLYKNKLDNNEQTEPTDNLKMQCGIFVSLHKKNELRGCIGRFESAEPLIALCKSMALAAAFSDPRFEPLTLNEFEDVSIEISVLSELKKIKNIDEIVIGKHGIYISSGLNRGTLLPQVAQKHNWTVEQFLGYCSKNKAGMGWDGWKTAEIYTFTAQVFSDETI